VLGSKTSLTIPKHITSEDSNASNSVLLPTLGPFGDDAIAGLSGPGTSISVDRGHDGRALKRFAGGSILQCQSTNLA
jgi:hypothetical protein